MTSANHNRAFTWLGLAAALVLGALALAGGASATGDSLVDFEDPAHDNVAITDQFSYQGITFGTAAAHGISFAADCGAPVQRVGFGLNGSRSGEAGRCAGTEFGRTGTFAAFAFPHRSISVRAGANANVTRTARMRVYDAAGVELANTAATVGLSAATLLSITRPTADIRYVSFAYDEIIGSGEHLEIDNLVFDNSAAPLHTSGRTLAAAQDQPFDGVVAHFFDDDPTAQPGDFAATIDWGDGQTSAGAVVSVPGNGFDVTGAHTWSRPGTFPVAITLTKPPYSRVEQIASTANVTGPGGGGTPPPAPVAAFDSAPARKLPRMTLLNGRLSVAAGARPIVQYRWDFTGNGSVDATCDGDEPVVVHPFRRAGRVKAILEVVDDLGQRARVAQTFVVTRKQIAGARVMDSVSGCATAGQDDRPNTADDCVTQFSFAVFEIEAGTGCFQIETLSRPVLYPKLIRPSRAPQLTVANAHFRASVDGPIYLNGLNMRVPKGVESFFDTGNDKGSAAAVRIRPAGVFPGNPALAAAPFRLGQFGLELARPGRFSSRSEHIADFDASRGLRVGGFGIGGKVSLDLGYHTAKATLRTELSLFRASARGGAVTGDVVLVMQNHKPFRLDEAEVRLSAAFLGPLRLQNVFLHYSRDAAGAETWRGGGQAIIPSTSVAIGAEASFVDGRFRDGSAALGLGPGIPLGPSGTFLTEIRLRISTDPLQLGGGVQISAGPGRLAKVDGDLLIQIDEPWFIRATGTASIYDVPLVRGSLIFNQSGVVDFDATFDFGFLRPVVSYGGEFRGFVSARAMSLEGSGRACLLEWCPTVRGIVSSRGVAACGSVSTWLGNVGLGFGFRWPRRPIPYGPVLIGQLVANLDILFPGCDLGRYRVSRAQASQSPAERTVEIPKGLRVAALSVQGQGALPAITLTGPHGERIETPPGGHHAEDDRFLLLQSPERNTVYIAIREPSPGTWRLAPKQGEATTPLAAVRQASGLPEPSVHVQVRGRGQSRRLSYRLRPITGQSVSFIERGPGVNTPIGTARGARGSFRFQPADGRPGRRRILAVVEQYGVPRETRAVGVYSAPPPLRPGRPRGVSVRRHRTALTVRWNRVDHAASYTVLARLGDGRRTLVTVAARRRTARFAGVGSRIGGTVLVTAWSRSGRAGPAARVTVRAMRDRRPGGPG